MFRSMSRRSLLQKSLAAGVTLVAAPYLVRPARAQTNIVYVNTYGGATLAAQKVAIFDPFTAETGIEVIPVSPVSYAKLRAQVESGTYEWDLTNLSEGDCLRAQHDGLTEPLDPSIISSRTWEGATSGDGLSVTRLGQGLAYRSDKFPNGGPRSWADFWDVDRFPGPRGMTMTSTRAIIFALRADGVSADKIYPVDLDRAFLSLDKIKKHITVWWSQGRQFEQLLTDGEVTMSAAWYEGVEPMRSRGVPIEFVKESACVSRSYHVCAKGAPNAKNAMRLLEFMTRPEINANYCAQLFYLPANPEAMKFVPVDVASRMPDPDTSDEIVRVDGAWEAEHKAALEERYTQWIAKG